MGTLQQSFNQALTGATFLLQQTPWWQDLADVASARREYKTTRKSLSSMREQAKNVTQGVVEEYEGVPDEYQNKQYIEYMKKRAKEALPTVEGLEEGMALSIKKMQDILGEHPSLLQKTPGTLTASQDRFNKGSVELKRIYDQLTKQEKGLETFRNALRKEDVDTLRFMGIGEEAIKKARYK